MSVRQMVAHCCEAKMNLKFIARKLHSSLGPADAFDLYRWIGQTNELLGPGSRCHQEGRYEVVRMD